MSAREAAKASARSLTPSSDIGLRFWVMAMTSSTTCRTSLCATPTLLVLPVLTPRSSCGAEQAQLPVSGRNDFCGRRVPTVAGISYYHRCAGQKEVPDTSILIPDPYRI
eukprot:888881-Rhodomonas_salina.1